MREVQLWWHHRLLDCLIAITVRVNSGQLYGQNNSAWLLAFVCHRGSDDPSGCIHVRSMRHYTLLGWLGLGQG